MPIMEETSTPLDLSGEGAAPYQILEKVVIPFEMGRQVYSNWCWAAVAASVAACYGKTYRQCAIANVELGRRDCCEPPRNAAHVDFDVANVFGSPLNRVGCLREITRFEQAIPLQVVEELKTRRPICVRMVWPDGGAHFLTITGYWFDQTGILMLTLDDPFWGPSEFSYDRFSKQYQLLDGTWNDTYYTKAPSCDAGT
jgi:hypothetical protein